MGAADGAAWAGVVVPCGSQPRISASTYRSNMGVMPSGVMGLTTSVCGIITCPRHGHFLPSIPRVGDLGTGVGTKSALDRDSQQCLVDQRLAVHDALLGCDIQLV